MIYIQMLFFIDIPPPPPSLQFSSSLLFWGSSAGNPIGRLSLSHAHEHTSGPLSRGGCAKPKRAHARPTGQSCDLQPPRRSAGVRLHRQHQAALDWTRPKEDGGEGEPPRGEAHPRGTVTPVGSGVCEPGICCPYRASLNWPLLMLTLMGNIRQPATLLYVSWWYSRSIIHQALRNHRAEGCIAMFVASPPPVVLVVVAALATYPFPRLSVPVESRELARPIPPLTITPPPSRRPGGEGRRWSLRRCHSLAVFLLSRHPAPNLFWRLRASSWPDRPRPLR
ncbi:uncharacterized protein LY79DRAFT_270416 [Colletotrichum navitas]|uniref:Uncharacterized protein n=1 Tax=Colletotrichum navitas TaxID=681940 RepID=A0AAD8V2Y8_9PEZI|nr:uncharacterized protein LY79DRAFT_270416 [Colletotrichum navitas]KAK1585322.1 hypothetical protein LY79DRAFT_270416 [Colletotrichum navitas]